MRTKIKNWPKFIYLQPGPIDEGDEEIDFDSLSHEHITWCSDNIDSNDAKYVLAAHVNEHTKAAMKEAREEYSKEFAKFVTVRGYQWNEYHKLWISIYHASEPGYTEQEMIDQFNTYLSAIEAEKERGNNG